MQDKFVLLPNVLYGTWMGAINDYKFDWSEAELKQKRADHLNATTIN